MIQLSESMVCGEIVAKSAPTAVSAVVVRPATAEPAEPIWLRRGQIPSLNGLRAISILMVVLAHLSHQGQLVPHEGRWGYLGYLGRLGVDMFFVISGFLITLLLLREQARHDEISLKQFYLRRAFRILPAYVCFLVGIALLSSFGSIALTTADWVGALTYTVSFIPMPSWDIGHIWSLSVEEHFYLLWPVAVYFTPRRAWIGAMGAIAVTPGLRWLMQNQMPYLDTDYCSLTRMDTIAVGCCLAYLVYLPSFREIMKAPVRHAYWTTLALALLVGVSLWLTVKSSTYEMILHPLVVACAYAATIFLWTVRAESLLGWLLNSKPAVAVGLLSYSIYLWQQPFLNPYCNQWYAQSPVNLICIAVLACGSYLLIERPILNLKNRISS
jgi:peptidoglycan/LPS O-acetylase OafA/YrhL